MPPVEISPPGFEPYLYGLFSVAEPVTGAGKWELGGISYTTPGCADTGGFWDVPCPGPSTPQPVRAFLITFTKAAGQDQLVATLTDRHAGYGDSPVFVNVDGDVRSLPTVGSTQTWSVTPGATADLLASNTAVGAYPQCSDSDTFVVPATADTGSATLSCEVTPTAPPPPPEKKLAPTGLQEVVGKPFTIYDSAACYPQSGRTVEELQNLARQKLVQGEQAQVEQRLWEQIRTQAVVIPPPPNAGTAWSLWTALGALETGIARQYGGRGVLHTSRYLVATVAAMHLADIEGRQRVAPGGDRWVFGAGYDMNGPDGTPAPAGTAWIYATGPVQIYRSEVIVNSTFDQRTNERRALAERIYALTVECPALATLIKVPECRDA